MHRIIKYQNGQITSTEEKQGAVDMKKKLEELRKKYDL